MQVILPHLLRQRLILKYFRIKIFESLRHLQHAPGIAQHDIPPDSMDSDDSSDEDPDARSERELDRRIIPDNELSDSEDEDSRRNTDADYPFPANGVSTSNAGSGSPSTHRRRSPISILASDKENPRLHTPLTAANHSNNDEVDIQGSEADAMAIG